jgi:hypothetical protein
MTEPEQSQVWRQMSERPDEPEDVQHESQKRRMEEWSR